MSTKVAKKVIDRVGLPYIEVSGMWLRRIGDQVEMLAENPATGEFVLIAAEYLDSAFSHIVEPNGIQSKFYAAERGAGGEVGNG